MKTLAVIDSLLHAYQLVVLLFEGPLLCRVSEEQGEIFTLLTEILVGSVTLSIPNSAVCSVNIVCSVYNMSNVRLVSQCQSCQKFCFYRLFSFYRLFRLECLVSIVCYISNI